jgi:hypothetical protein
MKEENEDFQRCYRDQKNLVRQEKIKRHFEHIKIESWKCSDSAMEIFFKLMKELPSDVIEKHQIDFENLQYEIAKIAVYNE